jgi:hypothetical protein
LAALLTGCGSTPTKPASSFSLSAGTKFSEPKVTVNLTQKITADGYPDESQMTKIIRDKITAELKNNSLLADTNTVNPMSLEFIINYQRRFAGEDSPIHSKSVMAPLISHTIIISEGSVEKHRIEESGLTINKGFGANLKTTFTLGLGKTAKDEQDDLQTLAVGLVSDIKELKE